MLDDFLHYVFCAVIPKIEPVYTSHLESIYKSKDGVFTPKQVLRDVLQQQNLELYDLGICHIITVPWLVIMNLNRNYSHMDQIKP